jgi:putative adenylate-forming enzyme
VSRLDIATAYIAARWRAATLHGARLADWQHRRATTLARAVRRESPFYRELWEGKPDDAWRTFPTVDKHAMMTSFDRFTTTGITREAAMSVALDAEQRRDFSATINGHTVGLSSGTSGHRGLFLVSPQEQTRWAGTILARAIPDLRPGHRVAFFLRANSRLYERTSSAVRFRFLDLMDPLPDVLAVLNDFQPQLIVGPPSLLGQLADAVERGTLRVRPTRLISVAEVIEPHDRQRIESVFQAPVGEVYQCTEGLVAVACRHGSLHVQEDVLVMQTESLAPDDVSRVTPILTDLWRHAQPIIRYRLGDILRLEERGCRCGSSWRRIAAIEGRQDDLCWFPQASGVLRVVFPDTLRRMVLLAADRIVEYRIEQHAPGALHLQIDIEAGADFAAVAASLRATIAAELRRYDCHDVAVTIEQGVPLRQPGVKRRRVVCSWRRVEPVTVPGGQ